MHQVVKKVKYQKKAPQCLFAGSREYFERNEIYFSASGQKRLSKSKMALYEAQRVAQQK